MKIIKKGKKTLFALIVVFALSMSTFLPIINASTDADYLTGFDKGPSTFPVVPLKKLILVNHDKESKLDDYSFLAAVSSAVFKSNGKLFSNPLLFFEEEFKFEEDKFRTLNPRQGLDYFMEDWMSYCNGELDQMILINIPKEKLNDSWDAREFIEIDGTSPYSIAGDIALQDWSYSDNAIVAVIREDYDNPEIRTEGTVSGTFNSANIEKMNFEMQRPIIGTGATYETFDINNENYKYILTQMSWDGKEDYDLQIYDPELGMVETAFNSYSSPYPFTETVGSFIYNYGKWEVSVSAQAKKSAADELGTMESMSYFTTPEPTGLAALFNKNTVDINIALLPGVTVPIEATPYGCRDIEITLEWDDSNANLGFTVLDPIGTEIASSFSLRDAKEKCLGFKEMSLPTSENNKDNKITLSLEKLGETLDGENYKVCIFSIGDLTSNVNFDIDYSWGQNFTKEEGDAIESA